MVSILISCYNVERFVDRGLSSITSQTYKDCEIIIVDDGSTDNTLKKLKEWEGKDKRLKIICHKTNRGLGAARNTGIENACGDYLFFFDIDDTVSPDLVEFCVGKMDATNVDFLMFGFNAIYADNPNIFDEVSYKEKLLTSRSDIRENYIDTFLLARHGGGFVWTKCYKRGFIINNNIRFGEQKIQQDEPFNITAILNANRIYISDKILYNYYIYSTGNNRSRYIKERLDIYLEIDNHYHKLLEQWKLYDDSKVTGFLQERVWGGLLRYLRYDLTHPDCPLSTKQKQGELKKLMGIPRTREIILSKKGGINTSFRDKIQANLLLNQNYFIFNIYNNIMEMLLALYHKFSIRR